MRVNLTPRGYDNAPEERAAVSAQKKRYYEDHRDAILARHRAYRASHREDISARGKATRNDPTRRPRLLARKREDAARWSAQDPKGFWVRLALSQARRRAKLAGMACTISASDIVLPDTCPVLGLVLDYRRQQGKRRAASNSPSLDRVDNTKGYVVGNVRVLSCRANAIKSDLGANEIRALLAYVEGRP